MRLLIAEDDATSRMILTAVCSEWGYDVACVEDGQAAWELMQQDNAPQLMIIDWEMPRMNGIEFCQRLREKHNDNPPYIILLTSRNKTEDIVEGLNKGANDYIAKPFDNEELQVRLSVGQRVLQLQSEVHKTNAILNNERAMIENILLGMKAHAPFNSSHIRSIQTPVEKTSGDVLFSASCPDGTQHLMLGDFTGHGITAALGGPTASDVFYKMTAKGLPMSEIGNEINRHMCVKMPTGLFLAVILLEINPARNTARIWNCGMENVLLFRDGVFKQEINSSRPALGIINESLDNMLTLSIQPNDNFYAYSDGIIETVNPTGEMFGQQRLITSITNMLREKQEIQVLGDTSTAFRGDGAQLDDITLVELTC